MRIDEARLPEGWDAGVVVERDGEGAIRRVAAGSAVMEVDGDRLVLRDTQEIPDADPEVALMALQSVVAKARGPGCSFCGKPHAEVEKLITGPNVAICDECIGACSEILAADLG